MNYLYDAFPSKTGANRFYISTTENMVDKLICRDKSVKNVIGSKNLLLRDWEGINTRSTGR